LKLLEIFTRHVSKDDHCLDVGCGDGGTSGVWLNEHARRYVGVDIAESAVRMATDQGLDARLVTDAAELPFPDQSFDVAVCVEILEHLFEPQQALAEVYRILRPDGRLIATVPNAAHWRNRLDLAFAGRWNPRGDHLSTKEPWRDPHIRFFTGSSLAALLENCRFEVLDRGGFAEHAFAHYMPVLRRLSRRPDAPALTRRLANLMPGLLAGNLYAVAQRG
jgi:methionine biosynthesis protein MetW